MRTEAKPAHSLIALEAPADRAPWLVLAIGNPSRGDDAFGALMAERLQTWLHTQPPERADQVELICTLQLHTEHVFDLQGRQGVLFVDAQDGRAQDAEASTPRCDTLTAMAPNRAWESHHCPPAALLGLYQQLLGEAPPPAQVLSAPARDFELGAPPSAALRALLDPAWQCLQTWLTATEAADATTGRFRASSDHVAPARAR